MYKEVFLSGYCRAQDQSRMVAVEIEDGDHIRLGNTDITCILSPGHTCGTMTFFFDVTDGEKTLRVGYFGGAGLQTMYKEHCLRYNLPLDRGQKMLQTLHKLLPQHVDIMLGNHPSQNRTLEKRRNMLEHPGENDFLDSTAWQQFFTAYIRLVEEFLALGC